MNTTVLNTKIGELENKIPNNSGLKTTSVLNTKTGEVQNKILIMLYLLLFLNLINLLAQYLIKIKLNKLSNK